MKRSAESNITLDQFPVPWSKRLLSTLGSGAFSVVNAANSIAPSEWLGIVSSHEGKNAFAHQDWQSALASALLLAQKQGWGILVADRAPYAETVVHACKRLHVPHRSLRLANCNGTTSSKNRPANAFATDEVDICDCGVLELAMEGSQLDSKIPIHDIATVFLANRLFVVALRSGGKMAHLLDKRLGLDEVPTGTMYLSLATTNRSSGSLSKTIDWLDRGVIGWHVARSSTPSVSHSSLVAPPFRCRISDDSYEKRSHQPIIPQRLLRPTAHKFLVHCTRARRGPWPDQSLLQFHDELLQQPWQDYPTALLTLQRILKQQRLLATDDFRRGSQHTVCFSSNELVQLLSMRRFRSHLARWDWEPYGIMIDLEWLRIRGARQVHYIDREAARKKDVDELSFCQVVSNGEGAIDWRQEQEWRIAGDVRLNQIPFSKAMVFVATQEEALAIQPLSRWPIVVCSKLDI
jgi:hypothetical protein